MPIEDKIKDLIESLFCPKCDLEMVHITDFQNGRGKPHKGDIIVCSGCATPLRLGDSSLRLMTNTELKALDKVSAMSLAKAMIGVAASLRGKSGKK